MPSFVYDLYRPLPTVGRLKLTDLLIYQGLYPGRDQNHHQHHALLSFPQNFLEINKRNILNRLTRQHTHCESVEVEIAY